VNKRRLHEAQAPTRDLGGWIVLAVTVSIILHFILLKMLAGVSWGGVISRTSELPDELPFKLDKVVIDKALLAPDYEAEEEEPDFAENPKTQADIIEIAEAIAEREVALTPTVDVPSNLILSKTPEVAGGPDLAADLVAADIDLPSSLESDLAAELKAMSEKMLKQLPEMSENQPVIDLQSKDTLAGIEDTFLEEMEKATQQGTSTATIEGFANLDDLVNYKGPILDNDKPILMPTDLLFGYDETKLRETARLSLMKLGILIQRNPGAAFIIEGHTDTTGDARYNQTLSEQRARAVKTWLRDSLKIESSQIKTVGFGETRPIANPTGTIEEQAINRRVEINFKPREESAPRVRRAIPVNEF